MSETTPENEVVTTDADDAVGAVEAPEESTGEDSPEAETDAGVGQQ